MFTFVVYIGNKYAVRERQKKISVKVHIIGAKDECHFYNEYMSLILEGNTILNLIKY